MREPSAADFSYTTQWDLTSSNLERTDQLPNLPDRRLTEHQPQPTSAATHTRRSALPPLASPTRRPSQSAIACGEDCKVGGIMPVTASTAASSYGLNAFGGGLAVSIVPLVEHPRGLLPRLAALYGRRRFGRDVEAVQAASHHAGVLIAAGLVETVAERGWRRLDPHLALLATEAVAGVIGCSWCVDF